MDPERYLTSLESVGWSFGLERIEALCTELGRPQDAYRSLHVVGTNGKTSTAVFCAEILRRRGLLVGTYVSPHLRRWSERTLIDGVEIAAGPFAAAAERVAAAASEVEEELGGRVTQFEAATATSLLAFAEAGVEVAVIEAGLGGRLDGTNVIDSTATALTSVGLDHTEWLGETLTEIAAEKLAVLRRGTVLVVGPAPAEVGEQARAHAEAMATDLRVVEPPFEGTGPPFLLASAAIALELARAVDPGAQPLTDPVGLAPGGRAQLLEGEPPVLVDVAHNGPGAGALAVAIEALELPRPRVGCVSVLAGKDAEAIVTALAGELDHLFCTAVDPGSGMGRPGAKALPPARLVEIAGQAEMVATAVTDPGTAVARSISEAGARSGAAIFFGSHYLLPYVWTARSDQSCSR